MRYSLGRFAAAWLVCGISVAFAQGHWTLTRPTKGSEGSFTLHQAREPKTIQVPLWMVVGLTPYQLEASKAEVRFQVPGQSGRLVCEGNLVNGSGEGDCRVADTGIRLSRPAEHATPELTPGERETLRLNNVSPEYLKQLRQSGYPLFAEDAARLKAYGVKPEMLQQLHQSGYESYSVNDMLKLQTYGIDSFDIQRMQIQGLRNLTPDEMVRIKQNGGQP